jgi:hypothetical protein
MNLDLLLKIIGAITAFVAALFALQKFITWLFPIQIDPSYSLNCDGTKQDNIGAKVTNKSSEPLYIVDCYAQGTFSLRDILRVHMKNPLIRPSLYRNVWYNGPIYKLMGGDPVKLEPGQPSNFECQLYEHPLNAMFTPYFIVIVKLSSGSKFRSVKLPAPARWRYIGRDRKSREHYT